MLAAEDGIVLGHSDSSVAFPGVPIMAFGIADVQEGDTGQGKPKSA
jgi:hypothetical protein